MPLDISLTNYNPKTARYNLSIGATGDVFFDETQAYAVQTAIVCRRNGYWADQTIGSRLYTLQNLTRRTPGQAIAMANDALDFLVRLNLINPNPSASSKVVQANNGLNGLGLDVAYSTPGGPQPPQKFSL